LALLPLAWPMAPRSMPCGGKDAAGLGDPFAVGERTGSGKAIGADRQRAPTHRVESASPCLLPGGALARPYAAGRRRHGLRLGLARTSCCVPQMAILLVIGVMDLRAMAVVAAAITFERLAPAGERVARAAGAVVVGAGLFLIARAGLG